MRAFLYLARRDKKGFKLLSVFNSEKKVGPARASSISDLSLPKNLEAQIQQSIDKDDMFWEPWLETANSFNDLKKSLQNRGYTNLPIHDSPKHASVNFYFSDEKKRKDSEIIPDMSKLDKPKTMVRRKSSG